MDPKERDAQHAEPRTKGRQCAGGCHLNASTKDLNSERAPPGSCELGRIPRRKQRPPSMRRKQQCMSLTAGSVAIPPAAPDRNAPGQRCRTVMAHRRRRSTKPTGSARRGRIGDASSGSILAVETVLQGGCCERGVTRPGA